MASNTAIILIDPYNDFLHPQGKVTPRLSESLIESGTVEHLKKLVKTARERKIPVYYGLHQQVRPGYLAGWKHSTSSQQSILAGSVFEKGSWGAEIYEGLEPDLDNGDVVVSKHWNSSSFNNTDLDYQLRQRDITNLVLGGLIANTCLESTARYAYELGYHITMLRDCTAGFTVEQAKAATDLIWPLFANKVTTVDEWAGSL